MRQAKQQVKMGKSRQTDRGVAEGGGGRGGRGGGAQERQAETNRQTDQTDRQADRQAGDRCWGGHHCEGLDWCGSHLVTPIQDLSPPVPPSVRHQRSRPSLEAFVGDLSVSLSVCQCVRVPSSSSSSNDFFPSSIRQQLLSFRYFVSLFGQTVNKPHLIFLFYPFLIWLISALSFKLFYS